MPTRAAIIFPRRGARVPDDLALGLPQHPDEHHPKRPVLLAVDQQADDVRVAAMSPVRPMTSSNARRIVRGVSKGRGTSPEYPDVRYLLDRWVPTGLPPEHTEDEVDRIATERSRQDEALQGHKKRSQWKRFLGRRGHVTP